MRCHANQASATVSNNAKFVVLVLVLIFATNFICSPETEEADLAVDQSEEQAIAAEPEESPVVETDPCSDLLAAHPAQLEYITSLLGPEGRVGQAGLRAESGWRIKSKSHGNAWYVGAWITGAAERQFGVWLVSQDPTSPGMTNSVSLAAERLSPVIPKGRSTRYDTSPDDEESLQLERCAVAP